MRGRIWTGLAVAASSLLLAGCGYVPATVALADPQVAPATLPDACLGAGLQLALSGGAYVVPLSGTPADVGELPSWESAALQMAPSAGAGPVTLCSYVADHPTPFSTRGGDDAIMCVLVDAEGSASLLGTRAVSTGAEGADCVQG